MTAADRGGAADVVNSLTEKGSEACGRGWNRAAARLRAAYRFVAGAQT
jgi:hypothetical protein